jgi:hypothetical protein
MNVMKPEDLHHRARPVDEHKRVASQVKSWSLGEGSRR